MKTWKETCAGEMTWNVVLDSLLLIDVFKAKTKHEVVECSTNKETKQKVKELTKKILNFMLWVLLCLNRIKKNK